MQHPEFPLSPTLIYLNHAAVSPWPLRASQAVIDFARQNCVYGSHFYGQWLEKESGLRSQFKELLNAPSDEDIALVKNTSEALSFVAYGLDWRAGQNIVTSNEEFPSNRIPWQSLIDQGVELREADLTSSKTPEDALFALVDSDTRLLTISSVQFASGLRMDLDKIGEFCKQRGILFCVDAIQSLGAVQFDVQSCQADFVMADGHKWLCGPEGLGVFYSTPAARSQLRLTQYGWHMMKDTHNYENKPWEIHPGARRFECGSPNMMGIHALSASLSLLLETGMINVEQRVLRNADYLSGKIQENPDLILLSKTESRLKSGIVVFKHITLENSTVYNYLQANGLVCAMRGEGIRLSAHFYQTEEELDRGLKLITELSG
ncbi:aminotransferase class V-fold PLP-dependent enzyme [Methylicorpusculum sp.]|uniref:aminotransferase class V-fold PLP-dependent enzyme n=1 Tax=Methylicorpusculum sp. TaxID=2713644 RepID=UPI00273143FF|nr:aminotransferase class V-fold PLP-dependent enzyme [Methylicorpusculum sp.]MDP2178714.1 aminotransferase class V-fold PLP-dependent enzyme [Methylicorpusculum sp.]MDP3527964.1 aminotransferase class V-fold PLP-dependent enzyme [Methylicorpusculum sp.]MDZ4151788.1 aminotransferase class V-fold PLP-dependent enzyme [Methylicorpusculum sp.]